MIISQIIMANYAFISFIYFFFFCLLITNGNEINQLYLSVQHDVAFEPIISDYMIQNSIFIEKILCPSMCLTIIGCQLVMYNSIESSCTIFNSTSGQFNTLPGSTTYVVTDIMATTTTTTTTTVPTTTTTTTTTTTEAGIGRIKSFKNIVQIIFITLYRQNGINRYSFHDDKMTFFLFF